MQLEKLLSAKQVKELTLYSAAHRARLEAKGLFPKRIRLSNHPRGRYGYLASEVQAWIEQRLKARS